MRAGAMKTAALIRWPLQACGATLALLRAESCLLAAASAACRPTESHIASLRTEPSPSSSIRDVAPKCMMYDDLDRRADSITRWNPISTGGSRLENAMARLAWSTQRHLMLAMLAFISDCWLHRHTRAAVSHAPHVRANVDSTLLLQQQRVHGGRTRVRPYLFPFIMLHTTAPPCMWMRRGTRLELGNPVDGIESRRRHVGW